ncbi:MAG: hypothetical protein QM758_07040 [Armatimonas sp.]
MTSKRLLPAGFAVMATLAAASTVKAQDLYVAGFGNNTVTKISATGVKTTFASGLNQPFGVAFSAARDLYVSNFGNGTITKISPTGVKTLFAAGLNAPTGIAFAPNGDLYVANYADGGVSRGSIVKISPTGVKTNFATGLTAPGELAFSSVGDLYVSNYGGGIVTGVYKISPAVSIANYISTGSLSMPYGLTFVGTDLYVVNYGNGRITKKTTTANPAVYTTNATLLYGGMDIAAWGSDLFVSNMNRGTIIRIKPGVGTAAPTLTTYATGLSSPTGIAFAP